MVPMSKCASKKEKFDSSTSTYVMINVTFVIDFINVIATLLRHPTEWPSG